jgi:antitoxin CptB
MIAYANQPMSTEEYSLLKWRARRGLLENDILLERFFIKHPSLSQVQGLALTHILNLTDRVLMDLLMNKTEIPAQLKVGGSLELDQQLNHLPNQKITIEQQILQFTKLPDIDESMALTIEEMIKQLQNS